MGGRKREIVGRALRGRGVVDMGRRKRKGWGVEGERLTDRDVFFTAGILCSFQPTFQQLVGLC